MIYNNEKNSYSFLFMPLGFRQRLRAKILPRGGLFFTQDAKL
jgi:hypothetical protein